MSLFVSRWVAFFFPAPGWKERYKAFLGGQRTWEVPGRPEAPKVVPFPVQWIPHRLLTDEEVVEGSPGFDFIEQVTCVDSGEAVPRGKSVCCLRCGVPLHEKHACMTGGFDPPRCRRCNLVIKLVA